MPVGLAIWIATQIVWEVRPLLFAIWIAIQIARRPEGEKHAPIQYTRFPAFITPSIAKSPKYKKSGLELVLAWL